MTTDAPIPGGLAAGGLHVRSVSTAVVQANFDWTIVRVETDAGVTGWGESFFAPGLSAIIDELSGLVVGADLRSPAAVTARMVTAASGAGSLGGIVHNAISGIDAAMWDAAARALGVPLWRLLGGRVRDEVPVYADCHGDAGLMSLDPLLRVRPPSWVAAQGVAAGRDGVSLFEVGAEAHPIDLDGLSRRSREAADAGYTLLKFDIDVPGLVPTRPGSRSLMGRDLGLLDDMLEAIRDGAGPDVGLAFDGHWRYDLPSATRLAAALATFEPVWVEDLVDYTHPGTLHELRRRTAVPLGGGENLIGYRGFAPMIETATLDVVTPDLGKVGGVREARRIGEAAADRGLSVAPHNIAGPVGTAFSAQVSATIDNLIAIEHHGLDVPFFDELVGGSPLITDGRIIMTDAPGIGVEPDPDAMWAHRRVDVPFLDRGAGR